jgi:DNA ligase 1
MALAIGQTTEIQGSGSKPYIIKNCGVNIFSCTCPGWRNCKGPVNTKTCKHLKSVNGAQIETARIAANSGVAVQVAPANAPVAVQVPIQASVHTAVTVIPQSGSKQQIIDAQEATLGRKLRQDEKTNLFGPKLLLAQNYEDSIDPTGYLISEKLDGCRALYRNGQFITRQGNIYEAPVWFKANLPSHECDGEVYCGRRMFQKTISVVKSGPSDRWKDVTFMIFDAPHLKDAPFEDRMKFLQDWYDKVQPPYAKIVSQSVCQGPAHLKQELDRIVALGGEGLMLRKPGSLYEPRRSYTLLKMKPWKDQEGEVIGYEAGKKANKGVTGGLIIKMSDGKTFHLGSGLTAEDRRNPPKIGAVVTFKYTDTTDDGLPKCASYVATRNYE